MNGQPHDARGLGEALLGDGRPLIKLTGLALIGSGLFACFLAATGHFLPHDIAHLGMTAEQLRAVADKRLVYFMMHDRVSFGGAIIAVGTLYLWLAEFPLRAGAAWAWWTLAISGLIGFASFLSWLGYGYFDTWHALATLVLLVIFLVGMLRSLALVRREASVEVKPRPPLLLSFRSPFDCGRLLLLMTAGSLVLGGLIVMTVGMTTVFVPQDLAYLELDVAEICRVNPRLVPVIAHDRAGFGGGVGCCGFTMLCCVWFGGMSRSLWQALLITGTSGFGTAIGVHFPIGYLSFTHLAPAYLGATMFALGMLLTYRDMMRPVIAGPALDNSGATGGSPASAAAVERPPSSEEL